MEDEKLILTMDNEVGDTEDKPLQTTEIEIPGLVSSIHPQLGGDSQLIEEGTAVEDEVSLSVGTEIVMETASVVGGDDQKVTEDSVEGSVFVSSEQDDTQLFGGLDENDISLDFDDSEIILPSNSLSITHDEPILNEDEIKILINEVEGLEDKDSLLGADYVETVLTSDIPTKMDYDIENCKLGEKGQVEVDSTLGQKDDAKEMEGRESLIAVELNEEDEVIGEEDVVVTEAEAVQEMEDVSCTPIKDDDGEESMEEDDPPTAENEMETETDVIDVPVPDNASIVAGKRKRGKNTKVSTRSSSRKTVGEDVCFICFDGGELVLCDRRGCPKAYHPSCVNRDEAFFRAKGRWNCGWHLCSICEKNGHYTCYTCTFSLCKVCTKDAVILCVRGNKGFCETCMRTVMLIENNEASDNEDKVDFDDKSSWEYLFKDYWTDLKEKMSITSDELALAKNPRRGSDVSIGKDESNEEYIDVNNGDSGSDSSERLEDRKPKRRLSKRKSKRQEKTEADLPNTLEIADVPRGWASQELLEFVMHMKDGDNSILSQFDVQALLLEYIKTNKLRDPRRKSQIICDARLENLFGKARVGHFEMLKLLESHFLIKDDTHIDDVQGIVVDTDVNQVERDETNDSPIKGGSKEKKRRTRKKGYDRGPQSNLNDYAAIDNHNINLIYLRRKLVEDVLEDVEKFHDTVAGTFVRIRIPGNNQKQDLYRLVQVIGTTKAPEPYKVGKRTTNLFLEVLNLDKTEVVAIDTISNQEFTEDECKRLRQSIKCGLINRLTVGDILHKTTIMHTARVNDWLEAEMQKLSHLRDRASEKGRKKELRQCVEKLQLLRTPEERRRRMDEIPEIHSDPKMDPDYESEDDDSDKDTAPENYLKPRAGSGFSRNGREPISPGRGNLTDSGSGSRRLSDKNWEFSRSNSGRDFPNKSEDKASVSRHLEESSSRNQGLHQSSHVDKIQPEMKSATVVKLDSFTSPASNPPPSATTLPKIIDNEKSWLYKDPSGKTQGPFSVGQLRKWSNTGYFPNDLKVWRNTEDEEKSVLLKDALAGKFHQKPQAVEIPLPSPNPVKLSIRENEVDQNNGNKWKKSSPTVQVPVSKFSTDRLGNNLPSPTPISINPTPVGINGQDVSITLPSIMNPPAPQQQPSLTVVSGGQQSHAIIPEISTIPDPQVRAINPEISKILNPQVRAINPEISKILNPQVRAINPEISKILNPQVHAINPEISTILNPQVHAIDPEISTILNQQVHAINPEISTTMHKPQINMESNQPPEIHANQIPSHPIPQTQGQGQPYVQIPGPNYSNPGQPSPWGVQNNPYPPPAPRPDGSNMGWVGPGQIPVNQPMMGWVGPGPIPGPVPVPVPAPAPVPANGNMNWNMVAQGPMNPGWVVPPGPGYMQPCMMNPGWFPQMGNPAAGWFPPNTNQPQTWGPQQPVGNTTGPPPPVQGVSGPVRPGWSSGPPPNNSGKWGNDKQNNGNRFSGQGHGQRDRVSGYNSNNNNNNNGNHRICSFHLSGFCRKGANCNHPHS